MEPHIRHRLSRLTIHYSSVRRETLNDVAHGDIDAVYFSAFIDLNHGRLRWIGDTGIESCRV